METRLLEATEAGIAEAARLLRAGELVGMPTETVYGLAADAKNGAAVAGIFTAKGRPQDNPLIVHIAERSQLASLVTDIPSAAVRLADVWWPGPLTMILPKAACIPDEVSAGLPTVAIRMPSHPVARALIRAAGPLAAPSANLSGSPSPTTAAHVMADLAGRIAAVLDGGESGVGLESTVVDMTGETPRLLRPGGITPEMLRETAGTLEIDDAVTHMLREGAVAASPGMKYKHYAPRVKVVLVKGSPVQYAAFVNRQADAAAMCFDGEEAALDIPTVTYGRREHPEEQAHRLFDVLRRLDALSVKTVYAACPSMEGVGLAVYNRLLRAAGFEVIMLDE